MRLELPHPAYVAGIIDGEGSVFPRARALPHLYVGSTCKELIIILARLGGTIGQRKPKYQALGELPFHEWVVIGERAALVLRACLPYMVIKATRTRVLLENYDTQTFQMTNPRRRRIAILEARAAMESIGWPVEGPNLDELPCPNGHPMTPENTFQASGGPTCRICRRVAQARYLAQVTE